ncbi:MAG: undecaprenyldiphospho-muramoylpentapeptide beta-N-acetylglucosaminyltransferase [Deltaproteobacteria bacterium]|jgi:UDP-N-acetylglucosamine--N-acetylmuramyl-(pentapeptide) pyrophosphoryl-undecaprenol N-acetylglucosamine transferase|nr:undecaprenyldiphospho-muramoylpentapeptide beta-N-acetylglucosaminyltransferase [Deltaproteobacteria bacterium]MBW2696062.1 undecaprenyldiphospho-muramoylpentapeptide beta-N-acetylglucosaminyltransferase [Deltaproteobacteria bacterium]
MALSFVIAGGGTGGHVTPALALGEEITSRGHQARFIGSEQGLEAELLPAAGFELVTLRSQQVMGRSLLGRAIGVLGILRQVSAARNALEQYAADIVVSVGGFAAMPTAIAAVLSRTPLVLVEPNAIPGRVNRLTAHFAKQVFVGFAAAAGHLGGGEKVTHIGIPLRRALVDAFATAPARKAPALPLRLFVFGGSQGARQINEAMMELAPRLASRPLRVFHQTGEADRERVVRAYAEAGLEAEVVAFEHEMPRRYRESDLALCRAGALTVAELAMAGLPSILIPYPFAADDHQAANADALALAGAAHRLSSRPLDLDELESEITRLIEQPDALAPMSEAAAALARPDAARDIVEACLALLGEAR